MTWRPGITLRVALVLGLFAAVLLTAVTWYSSTRGSEALRAATTAGLVSTAVEKEQAVKAWVEDRMADLVILAGDPRLGEDVAVMRSGGRSARAARERLLDMLRARAGEGKKFSALLAMEPEEGLVVAATDPDEEGQYKEADPFFVHGLLGPHVRGPYYSLHLRGIGMTAAAPLLAADGRVAAVLAGRLQLDQLRAIITRRTGLEESDDVFLVNRQHLLVTQPRLMPEAAVLRRGIRTAHVQRCLEGESGSMEADDYRGVPVLAAFRWIPERQLCLVVKVDRAEALMSVVGLRRTLLLFGGGTLAVALASALGLGRALTRPVRRLTAAAVRFGGGDLDVRLEARHRDELGLLAGEFNTMAAALGDRERQLRQAADDLAVANRELEAFSYSVSHDLRAPVRAVDGFSRILLERHAAGLPEEAQRYLGMVRDNAAQMGALVDDLLRFSQPSRQPLEARPVAAGDLVAPALDELRHESEGRQLEISVGDLPPCHGDPALLRQVWANLLSNAFKFTRRRQVAEIEIGCREVDGVPAYFVRDNGAGFDMRYAHKLFGVFQRLHRADEFEGTGVGLAIVQRIVLRHGGRVWAEAEVDRGATFHFTIGTGGEAAHVGREPGGDPAGRGQSL